MCVYYVLLYMFVIHVIIYYVKIGIIQYRENKNNIEYSMRNQEHRKERRMPTVKIRKDVRVSNSDRIKQNLKALTTSTAFSLFISVLTIYSIFAIDIDKGFFDKQASTYFSTVHVMSMGIFTAEIIINAQIQPDYPFQFYFWIDVFSTVAMILELIWVENLMNSGDNIKVAISLARVSKASRFSKIGARSTKIMKLIRLIKLLKFVRKEEVVENLSELQAQQLANNSQHEQPIIRESFIDQYDEIDDNEIEIQEEKEVRWMVEEFHENHKKVDSPRSILNAKMAQKEEVAKKIEVQKMGILMMKGRQEADAIAIEFLKTKKIFRPNVDRQKQLQIDDRWQELENLEGKKGGDQGEEENEQNTKVGQILKGQIQKNIVVMVMGVIMVVPILTADTWFEQTASVTYLVPDYLEIASSMVNRSPQKDAWMESFASVGIKLTQPLDYMQIPDYNYPDDFAPSLSKGSFPYEKLRESEKSLAAFDNDFVIFSLKTSVQVSSWINMARSIFITLLLVMASIFFIKDIDLYALGPLQKMTTTLGHIEKNPYGWSNDEQEEEEVHIQNNEMELETMILENLIIKMANLVALGVGQAPCKFISSELDQSKIQEQGVQNIKGAIMCIKIAHQDQIDSRMPGQWVKYFNLMSQIIHEVVIENGGYLFEQDQNYLIACWKMDTEAEKAFMYNVRTTNDQLKLADQSIYSLFKLMDKTYNSPLLKKYQTIGKSVKAFDQMKVHVGMSFGTILCQRIGSDFKLTMKALGREVFLAKTLCRIAEQTGICNLIGQQIYKRSDFSKQFCRKVSQITIKEDLKKNVIEIYKVDYQLVKRKDKSQFPTDLSSKSQENEIIIKSYMRKILKKRAQIIEKIVNTKVEDLNNWRTTNCPISKFSSFDDWLDNWKEAMEYFEEKQWKNAKQNFEICNDLYPGCSDPICEKKLALIAESNIEAPPWRIVEEVSLFF